MSFVYLIEEVPLPGESIQPWTKIGYTKNPAEWRLNANLKRGNPRELRFGAVYEFDTENEGWAAEKATHEAFKDNRGQKEWFSLPWNIIDEWCLAQGHRHRGRDTLKTENDPAQPSAAPLDPSHSDPVAGTW